MIPEIGHFSLILALSIALAQGIFPLLGAARGNLAWMRMARTAPLGQFLFLAIAFGSLMHAFISNDFSVVYVASNSNSALPLQYRIAATWGGHEGSMLLWVVILAGWTVAVARFSRHLPEDFVARGVGVMGLVSVGFIAFMLFTSNPFARLIPAAADGRDLNPLLQDYGMVLHPPMLYMGYVGFAVVFAFAIAALICGRLDASWARWSRPWTTLAWVFLTLGIALGSFWAYYELGWGGWWFWDPVENASFIPWLVGTALIHSLAVTEKRGAFKGWTVLLAIFTFSFSLLGTFLVRSGVLTSVHAFATDPARGIFVLVFLGIVIGSALLLFASRAHRIGLGGTFHPVSRESMLLLNNVLLAVAAGSVLLGTIYPLVLDALGLGKISVGRPYFEAVFVPLMAPAMFLMGVGPIAHWKKASLPDLATRLRWAFAVGVVSALLLPFAMGRWSAPVSLGLLLAAWIITSSMAGLLERLRHSRDLASIVARLGSNSRSYYGMLLAHIGVAVFIAGATLVKGYETEKDVRMSVGDSIEVGGYNFRLERLAEVPGPNYIASRGEIRVTRNGRDVSVMYPEKRTYPTQKNPMTEAAIDWGFSRHLYVAFGDRLGPTTWAMRIYHKPFVEWIWWGWLLMSLGGLLAVLDRRYRVAASKANRALSPESLAGEAGAAAAP
ncbi:MAG: heme lyase CcmF/NrfE family subunit [Betaproteobacteria bacterium]|nr:heme lyase CcmF/NrfE family subunit [Betaproteobacteria bacterium]